MVLDVSRMIFEGAILGGLHHFWGDPFLLYCLILLFLEL